MVALRTIPGIRIGDDYIVSAVQSEHRRLLIDLNERFEEWHQFVKNSNQIQKDVVQEVLENKEKIKVIRYCLEDSFLELVDKFNKYKNLTIAYNNDNEEQVELMKSELKKLRCVGRMRYFLENKKHEKAYREIESMKKMMYIMIGGLCILWFIALNKI